MDFIDLNYSNKAKDIEKDLDIKTSCLTWRERLVLGLGKAFIKTLLLTIDTWRSKQK